MSKDKALTRKLQINKGTNQATLTLPSQIVLLKGWRNGEILTFKLEGEKILIEPQKTEKY